MSTTQDAHGLFPSLGLFHDHPFPYSLKLLPRDRFPTLSIYLSFTLCRVHSSSPPSIFHQRDHSIDFLSIILSFFALSSLNSQYFSSTTLTNHDGGNINWQDFLAAEGQIFQISSPTNTQSKGIAELFGTHPA